MCVKVTGAEERKTKWKKYKYKKKLKERERHKIKSKTKEVKEWNVCLRIKEKECKLPRYESERKKTPRCEVCEMCVCMESNAEERELKTREIK